MMPDRPSVLFISSCDVTPEEIIKLVRKDDDVPTGIPVENDVYAFPYHIDNKYYSTDINLCVLKRKVILGETFASTVQGTVIYFDSRKNDCLATVDSWLHFLNVYQPEIKILLCKNCLEEPNEGVTKRMVQEWCIGKGFELVELDPVLDEDDIDDDYPETTGVSRIIQALNAHVWPNLILKNSQNQSLPDNNVDSDLSALANRLSLEESLEELLQCNDDFSQLFSQLPELKARVSSMQGTDRMAAACQIVEAFWKAMQNDSDGEDILDL